MQLEAFSKGNVKSQGSKNSEIQDSQILGRTIEEQVLSNVIDTL